MVREANTGVRRRGIRGTVLSKVASAKEEGRRYLWCAVARPASCQERKHGKCGSWRRRTEKGILR